MCALGRAQKPEYMARAMSGHCASVRVKSEGVVVVIHLRRLTVNAGSFIIRDINSKQTRCRFILGAPPD